MQFPAYRASRVRRRASGRALFGETTVTPEHLVGLIRVSANRGAEGRGPQRNGIEVGADAVSVPVKALVEAGVGGIYFVAAGDERDDLAQAAVSSRGALPRAIKRARETAPDMMLIGELDLTHYTKHGEGGILQRGEIDNEASLDLLAEMALAQAKAGVDFVAPSAALDGQVGWIRETLDEEHLDQVGIAPCTAHFASAFSAQTDRRSVASAKPQAQRIGAGNVREAMREAMLDIDEGADMLLVRPALPFVDIVTRYADEFELPLLGVVEPVEGALIDAVAASGKVERDAMLVEWLVALRRAGADGLVTPFALETAQALRDRAEPGAKQ
jgi:porphobilinogen synthase